MDLIGRGIGEIIVKQGHYVLAQETQIVRDQLAEIKKLMEQT